MKCGMCVRFCPVLNFNFREFQKYPVTQKYNPFIGNYSNILFGHTTDNEVWQKAAAGGIVSSILISALEKGLISGAVVVKIDENNLRVAKPSIARTREEIVSAAQSKYIPANVNAILAKLRKEEGTFAIVGLPCQVQAIRMLQRNGPKWIAEKIKYVIGLFCGYTLRGAAIDYLLYNIGISSAEIKNLSFRTKLNNQSSGLLIETKKGGKIYIGKGMYNFLFYLFPKNGCLYCMDYTAEFADISIGDMRPLPKSSLKNEEIEPFQSLIIIRTEKGMELLHNTKKIEVHVLPLDELIVSKLTNMIDRKICSHTRINLRRAKGLQTPNYQCPLFNDYLLSNSFKILTKRAYSPIRCLYEILWLKIVELPDKFTIRFLSKVPMGLLRLIIRNTIIKYKARGFMSRVSRNS